MKHEWPEEARRGRGGVWAGGLPGLGWAAVGWMEVGAAGRCSPGGRPDAR